MVGYFSVIWVHVTFYSFTDENSKKCFEHIINNLAKKVKDVSKGFMTAAYFKVVQRPLKCTPACSKSGAPALRIGEVDVGHRGPGGGIGQLMVGLQGLL